MIDPNFQQPFNLNRTVYSLLFTILLTMIVLNFWFQSCKPEPDKESKDVMTLIIHRNVILIKPVPIIVSDCVMCLAYYFYDWTLRSLKLEQLPARGVKQTSTSSRYACDFLCNVTTIAGLDSVARAQETKRIRLSCVPQS